MRLLGRGGRADLALVGREEVAALGEDALGEAGDRAVDRRGDRLPVVGDGLGLVAGRVLAEDGAETVPRHRSEEHTSELQSLMRISYAVFCLKKKKITSLSCTIQTEPIYMRIKHH